MSMNMSMSKRGRMCWRDSMNEEENYIDKTEEHKRMEEGRIIEIAIIEIMLQHLSEE